jgi:hypothetical protein
MCAVLDQVTDRPEMASLCAMLVRDRSQLTKGWQYKQPDPGNRVDEYVDPERGQGSFSRHLIREKPSFNFSATSSRSLVLGIMAASGQ